MKRITLHHDGHGRMEQLIVLATDEPATEPPGNSSHHRYEFFYRPAAGEGGTQEPDQPICFLQFQRGPFDAPGSTRGVLSAAVIGALIDHHLGFQSGALATRENALVITKLEEALALIRERADDRARRGVLGTMGK